MRADVRVLVAGRFEDLTDAGDGEDSVGDSIMRGAAVVMAGRAEP